ncbi:hypothetical protein EMIHUDRAFT_461858, partial [Emiliania huxleyi CCMP1516]|uniref:Fatty acid desaturase domain-containing protein n=2 Tax=Emiliania huxleyi TaxID=2903 RepID=A0A0D3I793_EMIH1
MLLRGALIGALLSWVAARATTAAGQLFLPVPLLGYFRADAGLLLVALACTAAALLPWWRLLPATCVGLAGPMALFAVGLDPPRFRHGGDKPVQVLNGSTAYFVSVAGALSPAECAALVRAVWDVRPSWTHASHAGALRALAYFHFPWSANFDKGDDPAEARCHAPLWSFSYGLRFLMGHESHHATHPQGAERRAALLREPSWTVLGPFLDRCSKRLYVGAQPSRGKQSASSRSLRRSVARSRPTSTPPPTASSLGATTGAGSGSARRRSRSTCRTCSGTRCTTGTPTQSTCATCAATSEARVSTSCAALPPPPPPSCCRWSPRPAPGCSTTTRLAGRSRRTSTGTQWGRCTPLRSGPPTRSAHGRTASGPRARRASPCRRLGYGVASGGSCTTETHIHRPFVVRKERIRSPIARGLLELWMHIGKPK